MKRIMLISISLLALLFAGCSTSKVTNSWSANDYVKPGMKKILVIGAFGEKDQPIRAEMEQELATDLKQMGFEAVTSYDEYGPKAFKGANTDSLITAVRNSGYQYDGVITISLVDKEQQKRYVSNPRYYRPYGYHYNPYRPWAYRPYGWRSWNRGHYERSTNFYFETNLYDINSGKVVYSVVSQSISPGNVSAMANDYSKSVIKDMREKNILSAS